MQRFNQNLNYYGTAQIKEFGQFLEDYDNKLLDLTKNGSSSWSSVVDIDTSVDKENVSCLYLIEAENKTLNKILFVFAQLCEEISCLREEFNSLLLEFAFFDDSLNENTDELKEDGEIELNRSSLLKISQYLEQLTKFRCYLERIFEVAVNIICQLGAIFEYPTVNHASWNLKIIFENFAELCYLPVVFDIVIDGSVFKTYWKYYVKQVQALKVNRKKLSRTCDNDSIDDLIYGAEELSKWLDGKTFGSFLDAVYTAKQKLSVEAATILSERMLRHIKSKLTDVATYHISITNFEDTRSIVKLNAVMLLYNYIFLNLENKYLKNLIEVNEKFCGLPVIGNAIWVPDGFLAKYGRKSMKDFDKFDYKKARESYLNYRKKILTKDILVYCLQMSSWLVRIDLAFRTSSRDFNLELLRQKCGLIFEGLNYAEEISFIIKSITVLHQFMQIPIQRTILQSIWKLVEFLQIIFNFLSSNQRNLVETKYFVMQHLLHQINYIIKTSKKKLLDEAKSSNSRKSDQFVDRLSAFTTAEKSMNGPPTKTRINIARLALSTTDPSTAIGADNCDKLKILFNRLEMLSDFQRKLAQICDPQFLYWHQSFFPHYIDDFYEKKSNQLNFKYFIQSTNLCSQSMDKIVDEESFKICYDQFLAGHRKSFNNKIIEQICSHIETYIRLDYYTKNSQMAKYNPFTDNAMMLNNIHLYINMAPMTIRSNHFVLKEYVQRFLSNMYYTLATISLHDWKVYKEMRCTAEKHYKLSTIDDQLPKQTLDQGLDVLDIMHDIENFVTNYVYNLNYQVFVEQNSNNNFVYTVNINHIANSLRTHGSGIINTTVNYTFQFLRQKFFAFSHFLFDEQIKARLSSDVKYFMENAESLNQTYDYERANAFNKKIKNLGLSPTGETYMDLFRKLICQIGNAMGYVRMIRSGALHECTEATVFLPAIDADLNFVQYAMEDSLDDATVKAAENLENDINHLCKNYHVDTNYFQLLVKVFIPYFRHSENIHLNNFYMIIPPLTINHIEYILKAKEKLTKKDKNGALFTDDGFAIGIAYILKLLDQTTNFNALHWFRSVKNKYNSENEKLFAQEQSLLKGNADDKLKQTFALTKKRLVTVQQEFDLLYFNLCSARIFFSDANI